MKTITARELVKQIMQMEALEAGVYIAHGKQEGEYQVFGIDSVGMDDDGEVYLTCKQDDALTERAEKAEAEVERLQEYEKVIQALERKMGQDGSLKVFAGLLIYGELNHPVHGDFATGKHASLFDTLKALAKWEQEASDENSN